MPSLTLENSIVDERYEVRRRLNHGSYAEIYEAYDLALNRKPVIIKALNTHLQGTPDADLERTLVENFQNEAYALDAVRHRSVVQRLGHGTAADLNGVPFHYLVLEYVGGGDLMERCRRKPFTLEEAIYYFRQVCEALDEAHKRGVIHRDIKPNNLLLSSDGSTIKIIDFGVAKMSPGVDDEVTRVGTDVYAPPEHNPNAFESGLRQPLTPSADVYSLAKTVYAAMTGKGPREFARKEVDRLPRELEEKPWGPRLVEVLRRATAKRVEERYRSVAEFWADFSSLAAISEDTSDETHVRPRAALRKSDPPPAAPTPEFEPHLSAVAPERSGGPRIVVELPEREPERAEKAPPRAPERMQAPQPAPLAHRRAPGPPAEAYSYREDLRDLIGAGWRLRALVAAIVLTLFASVAGVYYEVHRFVTRQSAPVGVVNRERAILRDGPNGQDIGRLPRGTRVRIVGQDGNRDWYQVEVVELGGPTATEQPDAGWVSTQVLDLDDD